MSERRRPLPCDEPVDVTAGRMDEGDAVLMLSAQAQLVAEGMMIMRERAVNPRRIGPVEAEHENAQLARARAELEAGILLAELASARLRREQARIKHNREMAERWDRIVQEKEEEAREMGLSTLADGTWARFCGGDGA